MNVGSPSQLAPSRTVHELGNVLQDHQTSIGQVLEKIFPKSSELTLLERVRRIMGDELADVSDAELEQYLVVFQSLIDTWLDCYEKGVFNGQTLQQFLREE